MNVMRKILLVLPVFLATLGSAYWVDHYVLHDPVLPPETPPTVVEPPAPEFLIQKEAVKTITAAEMKDWLYVLAGDGFEGRGATQPGYEKAAKFVEDKCKDWGLKTERQPFSISRGTTANVFAYIEGTDPVKKNEIIVMGAHLDHFGKRGTAIYNGADDNGSGSVALLALAQAFSEMEPGPRTIVFQWYSAEELGLVGSRYYCNNPTFPKGNPSIKDHIAMINLDMIGRWNGGVYRTHWHTRNSSVDLQRYVQELSTDYPFARQVTSHGSGGSDHACFYNRRIPVAFLHTGLHRDYHRTTDDPDKINYEGMEWITRFAFDLACKVMNTDKAPIFNDKTFRAMPYVHSHGDIHTTLRTTSTDTDCAPCRRVRRR